LRLGLGIGLLPAARISLTHIQPICEMGCLVTGSVAGAECEFQISCSKGRATIMIRVSIPLRKHTGWAVAVPLAALLLSACVSQSTYDDLQAQNQQLQQQNQQLQAQVAAMQKEATFVEAGDLLFPPGGFELSPTGQAELRNNIGLNSPISRTPKSSSTGIPTTRRSDRSCSGLGSTTI
jgi:hypothetical protein